MRRALKIDMEREIALVKAKSEDSSNAHAFLAYFLTLCFACAAVSNSQICNIAC